MTSISRTLSWVELFAALVFLIQALRIIGVTWGIDSQAVPLITASGLFASAVTTGIAGALLRARSSWRWAGQVLLIVPIWLWGTYVVA